MRLLRTFHHSEFPADRLRAERTETISVCVPARDEAATIAGVAGPLVALREAGVIDEVLVVDDGSLDATAAIAAGTGADVVPAAALLSSFGPPRGKGDVMWRVLSVARGDLVCFVDADSEDFAAHFVCGLLGPLVCEPGVEFVKGFYRRPFKHGARDVEPAGGGRVTQLTARPLLAAFHPELAGIRQPLAGEIAARRERLEGVAFCTGYGVDIALLLDVAAACGVDALAQVDLDSRQNRHQPLRDLGPMADAVLAAVLSRLHRDGRLAAPPAGPPPLQRPPLASLLGGKTTH